MFKKDNIEVYRQNTEAATRGVLWKKVFLKISQNSQENTGVRVSFLILKKRLWYRCFPVNFAKFLRKRLLQNTSERLLVKPLKNIYKEVHFVIKFQAWRRWKLVETLKLELPHRRFSKILTTKFSCQFRYDIFIIHYFLILKELVYSELVIKVGVQSKSCSKICFPEYPLKHLLLSHEVLITHALLFFTNWKCDF